MSPADIWAATAARFLRWKQIRDAERRDWQSVVAISPLMFHWLGADADKEAA
jgi:hypothetical protein